MIPKLNDKPQYEMTIPSTNTDIKFRPYLVKEEKVLMMAFESQDQKAALNAIVDTVRACVDTEINTEELKLYDVEYMFTKIRAKSVGENVKLIFTCSDCQTENTESVNIDNISVVGSDIENVIDINEDISVEMTYPEYQKMIRNDKIIEPDSEVTTTLELVTDCISCINTPEEKILVKNEPREKLVEFVESMTNDQFAKLRTYVESMPRVEINHNYVCKGCQAKKEVKIRNISDFF